MASGAVAARSTVSSVHVCLHITTYASTTPDTGSKDCRCQCGLGCLWYLDTHRPLLEPTDTQTRLERKKVLQGLGIPPPRPTVVAPVSSRGFHNSSQTGTKEALVRQGIGLPRSSRGGLHKRAGSRWKNSTYGENCYSDT
ncbi:hypothetical protein M747DRAFT_44905 [Aspergillus niger ATCC 13496]|uniref:Uncharacterized protein n=1 Tax=Aspergillus niger ATCC 13496 TaxID=1353008 RepID=A0A370C3H0_ASPNG|nr:hypothetical protein M747DRAFT_44905 [Aspergillus niger ATCC 13496]